MNTFKFYSFAVALVSVFSLALISCAKKSPNKKIEGTHIERESDTSNDSSLANGLTPQFKTQVVMNRTQMDECLKLTAAQLFETKAFVECTMTGLQMSTQIGVATGKSQLTEGLQKLDAKGWKATERIAARLSLIKQVMTFQEAQKGVDKNSLYLLYESLSQKVFNLEESTVATADEMVVMEATADDRSEENLETELPEKISAGSSHLATAERSKKAQEKLAFFENSSFEKELFKNMTDLNSTNKEDAKKAKENLVKTLQTLTTEELELQKSLVEKSNEVVQSYKENLNVQEKNSLKERLAEVGYSLKLKGITQKIIQGQGQLLEMFSRVQKVFEAVQK